jgi:hypothetical protein
MSDDYGTFSADLNGDGTDDPAAITTHDDGSHVLVGDLDHDGTADFAAYDRDGDGVYDQAYDPSTGEVTDLPDDSAYSDAGDSASPDAGDAPGGADSADGFDATDTTDTTGTDDAAATDGSGQYADPAVVSDMLESQHEANMAVINNI